MLKRTEELKEAFCLYEVRNSKIPVLSSLSLNWAILSGCVKSLTSYKEITKKLSESTSTIGVIIPLIASLKMANENTLSSELSENQKA